MTPSFGSPIQGKGHARMKGKFVHVHVFWDTLGQHTLTHGLVSSSWLTAWVFTCGKVRSQVHIPPVAHTDAPQKGTVLQVAQMSALQVFSRKIGFELPQIAEERQHRDQQQGSGGLQIWTQTSGCFLSNVLFSVSIRCSHPAVIVGQSTRCVCFRATCLRFLCLY